jgi:hypothetical protein
MQGRAEAQYNTEQSLGNEQIGVGLRVHPVFLVLAASRSVGRYSAMPTTTKTRCRATQPSQTTINFELLKLERDVVVSAEWVASAWRTEGRDCIRMAMLLQELNRSVMAMVEKREGVSK